MSTMYRSIKGDQRRVSLAPAVSFGAYEGLSDPAGSPREVQIAAVMGLISSDGAALNEIVEIAAANLSGPLTDVN